MGCASLKNKPANNDNPKLKVQNENNKTEKSDIQTVENSSLLIEKPVESSETLQSILTGERSFSSKDEKMQFCKLINENKDLFKNIQFEKIDFPPPTASNKQVQKSFSAKFNIEESFKDLSFIVEYPVRTSSGMKMMYEKQILNDEGIISFTPPPSSFAIDGKIKICLNLFRDENLKENIETIEESIEDELKEKFSISFPYKVATNNRRIAAAIAILDYDQNREPNLKDNKVANKLFVRMMKAGYARSGLAPFESLAKLNDKEIIENAKATFNGVIEYYFFGKTYITSLKQKEDGMWECKIEGKLEIWNLRQSKKMFSFNLACIENGKNKWEAIQKAQNTLGSEIMFEKILYNL